MTASFVTLAGIINTLTAQKFAIRHKAIRKYLPGKNIQALKAQIHFFNRTFSQALVLIQIGCYFETYGRSAVLLQQNLNYQMKPGWRKFPFSAGFHQRLLDRVCQTLALKQVSFVVIRQTGNYLLKTMERLPCKHVEFTKFAPTTKTDFDIKNGFL